MPVLELNTDQESEQAIKIRNLNRMSK